MHPKGGIWMAEGTEGWAYLEGGRVGPQLGAFLPPTWVTEQTGIGGRRTASAG